jgi:hypothetical protein
LFAAFYSFRESKEKIIFESSLNAFSFGKERDLKAKFLMIVELLVGFDGGGEIWSWRGNSMVAGRRKKKEKGSRKIQYIMGIAVVSSCCQGGSLGVLKFVAVPRTF